MSQSNAAASLIDPARPLCLALNHLLKQEEWARKKLQPHVDQVALIGVAPFEVKFKITAEGLVDVAGSQAPDVNIQVQSDSALQAIMSMQSGKEALPRMKIEGDIALAQTIAELAKTLRWEPEEDLSKVVGDVAAVRVMSTLRASAGAARTAHERLTTNAAEYLLEENPMLIRPRHVQEFAAKVQQLRDDVERMSKRIERISANNQNKGGAA